MVGVQAGDDSLPRVAHPAEGLLLLVVVERLLLVLVVLLVLAVAVAVAADCLLYTSDAADES